MNREVLLPLWGRRTSDFQNSLRSKSLAELRRPQSAESNKYPSCGRPSKKPLGASLTACRMTDICLIPPTADGGALRGFYCGGNFESLRSCGPKGAAGPLCSLLTIAYTRPYRCSSSMMMVPSTFFSACLPRNSATKGSLMSSSFFPSIILLVESSRTRMS